MTSGVMPLTVFFKLAHINII